MSEDRRDRAKQLIKAAIGSFIGIGTISYLAIEKEMPVLIASFGASAVLLYGIPNGPLSQPKNIIGGHFVSATVGVTCYQLLGMKWYAISLAVIGALILMELAGLVHPPGGATAVVAVMSQADYGFLLFPILAGTILLVTVSKCSNFLLGSIQWDKNKESIEYEREKMVE